MLGVWINYITLHGYVLAPMGNNNDKDNKVQDVMKKIMILNYCR